MGGATQAFNSTLDNIQAALGGQELNRSFLKAKLDDSIELDSGHQDGKKTSVGIVSSQPHPNMLMVEDDSFGERLGEDEDDIVTPSS